VIKYWKSVPQPTGDIHGDHVLFQCSVYHLKYISNPSAFMGDILPPKGQEEFSSKKKNKD
jgi:hypothetical protein